MTSSRSYKIQFDDNVDETFLSTNVLRKSTSSKGKLSHPTQLATLNVNWETAIQIAAVARSSNSSVGLPASFPASRPPPSA